MIDRTCCLSWILIVSTAIGTLAAEPPGMPGRGWQAAVPDQVGMDSAWLTKARDYALTGGGSGRIVRHGRVVMQWGDQQQMYDLKSSTKAIGVTSVGLALIDGKFPSLHEPASKYHPTFGAAPEGSPDDERLEQITLFHLALRQLASISPAGTPADVRAWDEVVVQRRRSELVGRVHYADLRSGRAGTDVRPGLFAAWNRPRRPPVASERLPAQRDPGGGPPRVWIGDLRQRRCDGPHRLSVSPQRTLERLADHPFLFRRRCQDSAVWREESPGRQTRRIWQRFRSLRPAVVEQCRRYDEGRPARRLLVLGLVRQSDPGHPFTGHRRGQGRQVAEHNPRRPLRAHRTVLHGDCHVGPGSRPLARRPLPAERIDPGGRVGARRYVIRKADGSDNWPITWADDDHLYTAYGDGWGFVPKVDKKLSLGFARITGGPEDFVGVNIRTETGERLGDGQRGPKASGMLCVDGVLYMLVRNTGNAQVAWSEDHARTWRWCDWKFETSFGVPTFLNFGRNYAGARDDYVYVYSNDHDSAYEASDRMVMARVPKEQHPRAGRLRVLPGTRRPRPTAVDQGHPRPRRRLRASRPLLPVGDQLQRRSEAVSLVPDPPGEHGLERPALSGRLRHLRGPRTLGPWRTVFFTETWDMGPAKAAACPEMDERGRSHLPPAVLRQRLLSPSAKQLVSRFAEGVGSRFRASRSPCG
jgi:hypothetical protein